MFCSCLSGALLIDCDDDVPAWGGGWGGGGGGGGKREGRLLPYFHRVSGG